MRVMSLMYHDVASGADPASGFVGPGPDHYRLTREEFSSHLEAIAASGLAPSLVGEPAGERSILLTFDDGGSSAVTTIHPMLAERGWRGHFFITVAAIGADQFLTADGIRELRASGHVIGSHGYSHRVMTALSDAEVASEWRTSKAILEDLLSDRVDVLSVPTGAYTERVGMLALEAGYRHVFTSEPWLRPRVLRDGRVYGRFAVVSTTPAEQVGALCRFSRRVIAQQAAAWELRKLAKKVLGGRYLAVRRSLLSRRRVASDR